MTKTVAEIAEHVGGEVEGNGSIVIQGLATVEDAEEGYLSMVSNPRFDKWIDETRASALLLYRDAPSCDKPNIRVDKPDLAFLKAIALFHPQQPPYPPGLHETAVLGDDVELGADVSIQAHVVIGNRVRIGDGVTLFPCTVVGDDCVIGSHSILYANVTLRERTVLGSKVIVHSGAVIGSDGFGFVQHEGKHHKIPQVGRVVIEDDVEIGANVTIDRATLTETRIKRGTKLDNLVHIAHNVVVGQDVIMAGQVGVSGSTKIGDNVMVGGQVGFVDHVTIGSHVIIAAQSGVSKNLPPNTVHLGSPARPIGEAKRIEAVVHKLPELKKLVNELQKRIKELEKKNHCKMQNEH